jgi:hypothetical protein
VRRPRRRESVPAVFLCEILQPILPNEALEERGEAAQGALRRPWRSSLARYVGLEYCVVGPYVSTSFHSCADVANEREVSGLNTKQNKRQRMGRNDA